MDIESLSDSELASMLKEHGFNAGPILESTRRVYQNKLRRMLAGETGAEASQQQEADHSDEEDDANADTQPIETVMEPTYRATRSSPARPAPRSSPARPRRQSPQRPTVRQDRGDDILSETSSRYSSIDTTLTRRSLRQTTETTTASRKEQSTPTQNPKTKKGLSIWIQVLIFLVVALVIFLVIQNMEPAAKDPIKQLPNV